MQPSTETRYKEIPIRTVELYRKPEGFGFTLSSQGPCVLSCILAGGPAHRAGLKPGDQIIEVNGTSVQQTAHEQVVKLIASSTNGMVRLGVRKRAEIQRIAVNGDKINHGISEEKVVEEAIINRVDKVVEELRSGQLFGDSSKLRQTLSSGKFISEEEVVSDEELKASFCESIRSESSFPGSSPAQSYASSRRSSEGDVTSNSSSPQLSRLLYPTMTPLRNHSQADIGFEPELRVIVGYLGSIELPAASSLQAASLTAIRNCVRRLRAQQKVHNIFVMEISLTGIQLVDSEKRSVVTYPLKSLAFTALCSDDKRVFGIVTRKSNEPEKGNNPLNSWHAQNNHKIDLQSTVNCSCHVFSVDPEWRSHEAHQHVAKKYRIQCTPLGVDCGCAEFPGSSSTILKTITGMFKERTGSESGGTSSDGEAFTNVRVRSASMSSSQSESDAVRHHTDVTNQPLTIDFTNNQAVNGLQQDLKSSQSIKHISPNDSKYRQRGEMDKEQEGVISFNQQVHPANRNDSGIGSDSYPQNDTDTVDGATFSQESNSRRPPPPVVSVSSFHSCESSVDSQFSMGSHYDPLAVVPSSILRKPRSNSEGEPMGSKERHLSNSQESLAHSDIVLGCSLVKKNLNATESISSSTQSIHSLSSMPGDMSQVDSRVSCWAVGFDKLMEDPAGLGCFKEFLKKEFSDENIVFWIACENFRNLTEFEQLKFEAENIFHNHLAPNAPMPVNIDSNAVKDAEEQLQNPNNDMFRLQQQQVYTLMKFDSYPRFLKSDVYRQSLAADLEGAPLPGEEGEEERELKPRGSFFWKVPFLYPSSEESEFSSGSSRSSFSLEGQRSVRRSRGSKHSSKRSTKGVEGERKKAFLPWKGKHVKKGDRSFGSQPGSARSSISSLSDSFQNISYSSESLHADQRRESEAFQFCRVVLPDQSSTILLCKEGQTLRQALVHLCDRRHLSLVAHEVYLGGGDKLVLLEELDEDMSIMGGREVVLEHRTLFRLELPDGVSLCVKVKPNQSVRACLEPILSRQGLSTDRVIVHLAECEVALDPGIPAASIEHQQVVIEIAEQFAGNANTSSRVPGRRANASRASRRGSKKNAFDDLAVEEVMRGRRQTLGDGHFDETGIWVPDLKSTPLSEDSLKGLERGDESGNSLLKSQGLFARKRREASEQDKVIPVAKKSGRFGNDKPADVKDFFELISKAQANRMDDQRGELKGNLELPDFLKIPNHKTAETDGTFKVPYAPPPPPGFRNGETNVKKLAVKKTLSNPVTPDPEKIDLMQELSAKLSKRSDSTKTNSSSPKENTERNTEQNEMLLDYNFNSRPQPQQEQNGSKAVGARRGERNLRSERPRSSTDVEVYAVDSARRMRVETGPFPRPVSENEPPRNVAHVQPLVRSQGSQLLTVNSLRGIHYATNPRRNAGDQAAHYRSINVGSVKPQTIERVTSKSSQNMREATSAIYNVKTGAKPGSIREAMQGKGFDDSRRFSSTPVDIPSRKIVSAYSLPEVSTQKAEILVPSAGGPPPVPRRTVSSLEARRPRPKPIIGSQELLAGLENTVVESQLNASPSSPPSQDITRVASPLPPPPTPPSGSMHDLQLADFSPPPSICESPEGPNTSLYRRSLDSSITQQTSTSDSFPSSTTSQARHSIASPPNFSGPVAYVDLPNKDVQRQRIDNRSTDSNKQSIKTDNRLSNSHVPNPGGYSNQRGRSEDHTDAASQPRRSPPVIHTLGSETPPLSNSNKTMTPPSTNERTLVDESSESDTPYTGQRPPKDVASKRLVHGTSRSVDSEKRRSRQDGDIPKLDPYVTYEKEDLRITFV